MGEQIIKCYEKLDIVINDGSVIINIGSVGGLTGVP